eukprot:g2864.t1
MARVVARNPKRKTCNVKYLSGGTEKDVALEHLSSLEEAEARPRRGTRSKSPAPRRRPNCGVSTTVTSSKLAPPQPSTSTTAAAVQAVVSSSDAKAFAYACAFLLCSIANTVAMKQTTTALPNYTLFVSFVHILVLTAVFFACATAPTPESTPAERSFVILGALDALAGVLVLLGSVHTSGSVQQLLLQMTIPLTILQSWLFFGKRYSWTHLLGAAVMLGGVAVVLKPKLDASGTFDNESASDGYLNGEMVFNIIFFLATLPMVGATLFKEAAMTGTQNLDGNWLNYKIGLYQILFTALCLPVNALPLLGDGAVPLTELPTILADGAACVVAGVDAVTPATHPGCKKVLTAGHQTCDRCYGAWRPLGAYLAANFLMNVFLTGLLKHAGSTLMFAVTTVKMPMQAIAFSLPLFMGTAAQPFALRDAIGLAIMVAGILLYKSAGAAEISSPGESKAKRSKGQ